MEPAIKRTLDHTTWPEMTKEEWMSMSGLPISRGFGKTMLLFSNWVAYGVKHGWLTIEQVQKILEEIKYGKQKS